MGYGAKGKFDKAHTLTMQNELFNDGSKFSLAQRNFHIVESTAVEDPLSAVHFAAKLPFRAGVSKSIVLIPCGECREMSSSYLDVQQLLLNRDIRLHVLQQEDFELKKTTPTSSYIFGELFCLTKLFRPRATESLRPCCCTYVSVTQTDNSGFHFAHMTLPLFDVLCCVVCVN